MTRKELKEDAVKALKPDLQNVGLKATLPRMHILEVIRESEERHLSAESVYQKLLEQGIDVGIATVYRVLSQLEAAGLLSRNIFDNKAAYELNEGDHHDHLICLACGRIEEFNNEKIEAMQREIAAERGYELTDHQMILYGYCRACVPQKSKA